MRIESFCHRIDRLAVDVGRLHRTCKPGSSLSHLADRLANDLETLDAMVYPAAADLHRGLNLDVDEALAVVDGRANHLRQLLGRDTV